MAFDTTKLGKLVVEIGANLDELQKGLKDANSQVETFDKKTSISVANIAKGFAFVGGAIVAALGAAVVQTVKYSDEIFKASQRSGIATETLSKLKFVAEQTETSFEELTTGLKFLAKNAFEASQGNKELLATFNDLGISIEDADGNLRSVDDILLQAADKFSTLNNETEKTALAIKLFGRSGASLIPVLNLGADGIERLSKRAEQLGLVLTGENAKAIDEFDDAMKEIKASVGGVALIIANTLLPALKNMVDFIRDGILPILENMNAAFVKTAKILKEEQFKTALGSTDPVLEDARRKLILLQEDKERVSKSLATSGGRGSEGQQQALNNLAIQEERIRNLIVDRMRQINEQQQANIETQQTVNEDVDVSAQKLEERKVLLEDLATESQRFFDEQNQLQIGEVQSLKNFDIEKLENFKFYLEQKAALSKEKEIAITKVVEEEIKRRRNLEALQKETTQDMFRVLGDAIRTFVKDSKAASILLKGLAIGRAIINTAEGVTKALALGPIGIPIAKLIKVLGAIEIATIAATGFAEGADKIPARLAPGEMVIPATFADAIRKGRLSLSGPGAESQRSQAQVSNVTIENIEIKVSGDLDRDAIPEIMEQVGSQIDSRLRGAT